MQQHTSAPGHNRSSISILSACCESVICAPRVHSYWDSTTYSGLHTQKKYDKTDLTLTNKQRVIDLLSSRLRPSTNLLSPSFAQNPVYIHMLQAERQKEGQEPE
jgi:hypothetical protein